MIELRELRAGDRDLLYDWRNRPEVAAFMFTDHRISREEHQRWFEGVASDSTRQYWIIVADGRDVGLADLYDIDIPNSRCSWGLYIAGTEARGKGVGIATAYLVMNEVFERRRLDRLTCEVLATNTAALGLYRRCGFAEEGVLKDHVRKDGRPTSVVLFAMLRHEWLSKRKALAECVRVHGALTHDEAT